MSKLYITGDCHGGIWAGEQVDGHKLDWLENKPFTTLFVCGNHENFDLLSAYPEKEWHGGKVHEVRPQEMPSEAECAEAEANLERAGWCVDCVLTHCAPTSIAQRMNRHYQPDQLTDFLEMVRQRCRFSTWFCGHYHVNHVIDERFVIQWEQISQIETDSI